MSPDDSSDDASLGTDVQSDTAQGTSERTDDSAPADDPERSSTPGDSSRTDRNPDFGQGGSGSIGGGRSDDGHLRQFLRKQFAMQMENVIPEDLQNILDKVETRLQAMRDSQEVEFADKVYGRIRLAARMLQASVEGSFQLPWKSTLSVAAGLTYLINPMNFLPGIVKGEEAVLDDALVVYLCYTVVEQDLNRFLRSHDLNPEEFGMDSVRPGF